MSITDELRKEARGFGRYMYIAPQTKQLISIADRIDAEHEKAMSRAGQLLADAEKDRDHNYANWQDCKQKVLQGNITFGELNAEIERLKDELAHCIELPKDADNVPWNIGDRDEDGNVVTHLMLSSDRWYVLTDGIFSYYPERRRHHHALTVEDVMVEFATDWECAQDGEDKTAVLKEYAAKLQLTDDGKEQ